MTDASFDLIADRTLNALLLALDEVDDIEAELSQGVLTVCFPAGPAFVVNSHRAAGQIWLAADRQAWHFDPSTSTEGERWSTRKLPEEELWAALGNALSRRLGRSVVLK